MDITIEQKQGETAWSMTDLLGRSMGRIVEEPPGQFNIYPEGGALKTMAGMKHGSFYTLDDALAEIERFTRGTCMMAGTVRAPAPWPSRN